MIFVTLKFHLAITHLCKNVLHSQYIFHIKKNSIIFLTLHVLIAKY